MAYRVDFAARAARDLEILYLQKNAVDSQAADCWFNGLEDAIYTLETNPERCPIVPEGQRVKRKLRHLLYGKKPHVYRVIYEIDQKRQKVWVLTIRHGARRRTRPKDLK
jgi:toxin ParE1/3/4